MSEITLQPRQVFGYILVIVGVVLIGYVFFQSSTTVNVILEFIEDLGVDPSITLWLEQYQAVAMPGFIEMIGYFLMLLLQLLAGFFLAFIGQKFTR